MNGWVQQQLLWFQSSSLFIPVIDISWLQFNGIHKLSILFCQIEYDDRAKASPLKEQPKQIVNTKPVVDHDEDGEDDLDIDAI